MEIRTIGQLAAEAGVAVDTVRYYERVGLLPRPQRQRAGWRRYSPESLARLQYIRKGRAVGFTLRELSHLIGLTSAGAPRFCLAFDAAVNDKIRAIDAAIADLTARRTLLEGFSKACRHRRQEGRCPILENLTSTNNRPAQSRTSHETTTSAHPDDSRNLGRQRGGSPAAEALVRKHSRRTVR